MPRVAALYRYPVNGFTPEECETLTVLDEGRIAATVSSASGLLIPQWPMRPGVRNGDGGPDEYPRLARLHLKLRQRRGGYASASPAPSSWMLSQSGGRQRLAAALAAYVLTLDENPLAAHPERLPLRVIATHHAAYHDAEAGR